MQCSCEGFKYFCLFLGIEAYEQKNWENFLEQIKQTGTVEKIAPPSFAEDTGDNNKQPGGSIYGLFHSHGHFWYFVPLHAK